MKFEEHPPRSERDFREAAAESLRQEPKAETVVSEAVFPTDAHNNQQVMAQQRRLRALLSSDR